MGLCDCGGDEEKEGLCGGDEAKEGLCDGGDGAKEGLCDGGDGEKFWGEGGVLGRLGSRLIIVAGRGGGELILRLLKTKINIRLGLK